MQCWDAKLAVNYNLSNLTATLHRNWRATKQPIPHPATSHVTNHTPRTPKKNSLLITKTTITFDGLGEFHTKPYHITLEPEADHVIHSPLSVPVHQRDLYKDEIDKMLQLGVTTRVDTPTDWVNIIVLWETTNGMGEITKLRVCLDHET